MAPLKERFDSTGSYSGPTEEAVDILAATVAAENCGSAEPFVRAVPFLKRNARKEMERMELYDDGRKVMSIIKKGQLDEVKATADRMWRKITFEGVMRQPEMRWNFLTQKNRAVERLDGSREELKQTQDEDGDCIEGKRDYQWVAQANMSPMTPDEFDEAMINAGDSIVTDYENKPIGRDASVTFMTEEEVRRKELQRGPYSTMIADIHESRTNSSKSVAAWLPGKRRKPTDWCVAGFAGSPHVFLYDLEHYPASRRRRIYDGGGKDGWVNSWTAKWADGRGREQDWKCMGNDWGREQKLISWHRCQCDVCSR